jgi:hypothetical protein
MRPRIHIAIVLALGLVAAGCGNSGVDSQAERPKPAAPTEPATAAKASSDDEGSASVRVPEPAADKFRDYVAPKREPRDMTLVSIPVDAEPVIDGRANESFWEAAPAITTLDYSSQRPITLRSAYGKGEIFFLITFPEEIPHETHKTWTWDKKEEVYREGPDREDVFVFKWSMSGNGVDLRLREPMPHQADIWFWKAFRTNPAGYADDKGQGVSLKGGPMARKIQSPKYGTLYFERWGDSGKPAWEEKIFYEYQGDKLPQFAPRPPSGSRGDVRAKGVWSKGQWTIEFARKLKTGHDDDVVFAPGSSHLFAVACYAMALDTPHAEWSRPLYRTGDAFDRLLLSLSTTRPSR